jgi:hypothetical protein
MIDDFEHAMSAQLSLHHHFDLSKNASNPCWRKKGENAASAA